MTRISNCKLLIITLSFLLLVNTLAWSNLSVCGYAQAEGIWAPLWFPMIPSLNDVYFIESGQGWVVGDSPEDIGFIAHTNGDGWKVQFQALQFTPEAVQFLSSTKGWVAGWRRIEDKKREGVLFYTENGGKHWNECHRFPWALYSLQFVTESHGWAIGVAIGNDKTFKSVILATTDGGEHWTVQYEKDNEILDDDLCFTDVNNGWVPGTVLEQDEWKSVLLHTTDGGENWTRLPVGEKFIEAIDFISAKEGWKIERWTVETESTLEQKAEDEFISHWTWAIFHTQDGGQTWAKQKTSTKDSPFMPVATIFFVDENEGWAMISGHIFHTADGGNRWTVQEYKFIVDDIEPYFGKAEIYFLDSQQGWIVGRGILSTTDGGMTWLQEPLRPFGDLNLNEIVFVTSEKGWVIGEGGVIFHTVDGGLTWQMQESSTSAELLGAHFIDTQEGWVVGAEGTILHTTDGGNTWVKQKRGTQASLKDVQFLDTQEGWVVGETLQGGIILHTVDGGNKWETVHLPNWLKDVHFVDTQTGWIVGYETILHTEDGGKSWRNQRCADIDSRHLGVYFLDAVTGWMVSWYNIAYTIDGGFTWKAQYKVIPPIRFETLYFANRQEGWAVGSGILHTTDGGETWSYQHSLRSGNLRSICYGGKNTLWAVGEKGTILKYSDPNLRIIEPSYWAVEPLLDKDVLSWGQLKQLEQGSETSISVLTNRLYQNYPNPFNPETWIPFELAERSEASITIYDATGRMIRTIKFGQLPAGIYTSKDRAAHWDGLDSFGEKVSSGVYFYQLQAGDYRATKRMLILK